MVPLAIPDLTGQTVRGWHVRDGALWVELEDRGAVVACACGRGHLLPREEQGVLHLTCHACGRHGGLVLVEQAFSHFPA